MVRERDGFLSEESYFDGQNMLSSDWVRETSKIKKTTIVRAMVSTALFFGLSTPLAGCGGGNNDKDKVRQQTTDAQTSGSSLPPAATLVPTEHPLSSLDGAIADEGDGSTWPQDPNH